MSSEASADLYLGFHISEENIDKGMLPKRKKIICAECNEILKRIPSKYCPECGKAFWRLSPEGFFIEELKRTFDEEDWPSSKLKNLVSEIEIYQKGGFYGNQAIFYHESFFFPTQEVACNPYLVETIPSEKFVAFFEKGSEPRSQSEYERAVSELKALIEFYKFRNVEIKFFHYSEYD